MRRIAKNAVLFDIRNPHVPANNDSEHAAVNENKGESSMSIAKIIEPPAVASSGSFSEIVTDHPTISSWERRLAPVMFGLSFIYLLTIAGLIHRATATTVTDLELFLMNTALALLWPIFAAEAIVAVLRKSPDISWKLGLARVMLVVLIPPMRMAWIHPATNRIWLPRLGWHPPGKPLLKLLDKLFGIPMLLFAFLILPVLGLEYTMPDKIKEIPSLALALDIGIAVIWVAFATEFIVKVSASPRTVQYIKERWLDLAIVLLPTLEFILTRWVDAAPLARLLRLGRAIGPDQIARMNKLYRLRGLIMKGWHAFLLLEGVGRLLGNTAEKRLQKIEDQIAELEEQIAELRQEAEELRRKATPHSSTKS